MRRLLLAALLAAPLHAETLGGESEGFTLVVPRDWEHGGNTKNRDGPKAHLRTFFGERPEASNCDVELYVRPALKEPLADTAAAWRRDLEAALGVEGRTSEGALDGVPCVVLDFASEGSRWTYRLAAKGDRFYVLSVARHGDAVDDADIEADVKCLVASVRLLAKEAAPVPDAPPAAEPEAEEDRDETIVFEHWRLRCVRPAGLRRVDPAAEEKDQGVVLRVEGSGDQHSCVIRVYAHLSKHSRHRPVEEVARWIVAHFEKENEKRNPVVEGTRWDVPLAKETRTLRLVAKGTVVVTRLWYLAECRNERQYWVEITLKGTGAEEAWRARIDALLAGFSPERDG